MPNQSLVDLMERTATADTDLIHVNSGGSDYKQTKANFTFDLVQYHEFNNTESLTSQCDSLATSGKSPAYYVGKINSYGHQSATGVPFNNSYHVQLSIYSGSYVELTLMDVDDGGVFRKIKANGTWQSSWTMQPTRAEITSLNNSLTNIATNVTGTTPSSSVDLKVAYPSGLSMSNCAIVNVEIYVSGIWRNLSAMANQSNYRVITSLRSDGIYVYPTGSDAYGVAFRITLLKV